MLMIFIWISLFSITTAISVVLMGSKDIISPDFTIRHILGLFLNWKFILGIGFAFLTRIIFLLLNNSIYNIEHLSNSSTTITFLATTISIFIVLIVNHFFLDENLNMGQSLGALMILVGIFLLFYK